MILMIFMILMIIVVGAIWGGNIERRLEALERFSGVQAVD